MKLIFVYNAKSGMLSSLINTAHKIISPNTYPCSLCKLTHANFSEKKIWKEFKERTAIEIEFVYSNNYRGNIVLKDFPVIMLDLNEVQTILLDNEELNRLNSVNELIARIKKAI